MRDEAMRLRDSLQVASIVFWCLAGSSAWAATPMSGGEALRSLGLYDWWLGLGTPIFVGFATLLHRWKLVLDSGKPMPEYWQLEAASHILMSMVAGFTAMVGCRAALNDTGYGEVGAVLAAAFLGAKFLNMVYSKWTGEGVLAAKAEGLK